MLSIIEIHSTNIPLADCYDEMNDFGPRTEIVEPAMMSKWIPFR